MTAEWSEDPALTVVLASKGYPGAYDKATPVASLPEAGDGAKVFHAGTALKDGTLVATGGRVLNATARGATVAEAQAAAYRLVDAVRWITASADATSAGGRFPAKRRDSCLFAPIALEICRFDQIFIEASDRIERNGRNVTPNNRGKT